MSASSTGRGTIAATAHVLADSFLDDDGETVSTPVQMDKDYRYGMVRADGAWKIDAVFDVTGRRIQGQVTADQQRAVDRMMDHWSVAYSTGDCAALHDSTTERFRETSGWADCAAFQRYVDAQNAYCPMSVHQEDIHFHDIVDRHSGEIFLDVVQVCTVAVDESGNPIDPPYQVGEPNRFHLVESDGAWKIANTDDGAAAKATPSNTNERAAVDAMRTYSQAWNNADCDDYLATTTAAFRNSLDLATCESFIEAARSNAEYAANLTLTPTDIERPSSKRMEIKSHETYDALTDSSGQLLDVPTPIDVYYLYTLDLVNGSWVISSNPPLL